jgi:hypothetical protein
MPLLLLAVLCAHSVIDLHPAPQHADFYDKRYCALARELVLVVQADARPDFLELFSPISSSLGFTPALSPAGRRQNGTALHAGTVENTRNTGHKELKKYLSQVSKMPQGGYVLEVTKKQICLLGTDRSGLINGIQTLVQMIEESKKLGLAIEGVPVIPCAFICDYPDTALRAAWVQGALARPQLESYAALKCNMLFFESDDFYDLDSDAVLQWQERFRLARQLGMTPVPVFDFFNAGVNLLKKYPAAVEGRARVDHLTMDGETWIPLSRTNLIYTETSPIRVQSGNQWLDIRKDLQLQQGGLMPPYLDSMSRSWLVRPAPESGLPARAPLSITYSHAPAGSNALCPHAPESAQAVRDALQKLIDGLQPEYLHCGGSRISRINQDLRCRDAARPSGENWLKALTMIHSTLRDLKSPAEMILWADHLLPRPDQPADKASLDGIAAKLPGNPILFPRFVLYEGFPREALPFTLQWMKQRDMPLNLALSGPAPHIQAALQQQAEQKGRSAGVCVLDQDPHSLRVRTAFNRAWSAAGVRRVWPEALNHFFDAVLWTPSFEEIKKAQMDYLDWEILKGEKPADLRARFKGFLGSLPGELQPRENPETAQAQSLFDLLTRYLEEEFTFSSGKEQSALSALLKLIKQYEGIDPDMEPGRTDRIQETVKRQKRFVPASILFGESLAYYRPYKLDTSAVPYEVPVRVDYTDERGRTQAQLDFFVAMGPVFRIDFETLNSRRIILQASEDGISFTPVPLKALLPESASRGPLFIDPPISRRYLRLQVESTGEQAVLREVRAFAWKKKPVALCPAVTVGADGLRSWPEEGRITGLVAQETGRFAKAPTEFRLAHNGTHLFIGVIAQDPTPHAATAVMTGNDDPLWEEESVEIRIKCGNSAARRFIINPKGARYDAMDSLGDSNQWDPGWDADWRAQAEQTAGGWSATVALPFTILGGTPGRTENWQINFHRHRKNIEEENSLWALPAYPESPAYGELCF